MVFGRRAGVSSAEYVKNVGATPWVAKLGLKHLDKYIEMLKSAKIKTDRKAPILLPDYRGKAVLARMIDVF